MLELSRVTAGYGRHQVLTELDLSLSEPGLYLVLGANRSGKSTLLKVASGRLKPIRGSVRMGDSLLYRVFGKDPPLHEYVSSDGCVFADVSLSELHRLKLETVGLKRSLDDFLRGYDVPWSQAEFVRLRPWMLSESERLELQLLLALAIAPQFLFVDELTSPFDMKATQRMTANLQRWRGNTGGIAIIASSRFYGFMDAFMACYVLKDGKLLPLKGLPSRGLSTGVPAEAAEMVLGAREPNLREVTLVFGEFFYRHHRIAQDNPHFELLAVLENALLVRIKGTLDGTLDYLRELGLDPIRIDFSVAKATEDSEGSEEAGEAEEAEQAEAEMDSEGGAAG